ncbi:MAG: patatin-like phospholipase family protein [Eubacteriales bacterium]|nr:patatin-like phospholipase family protein [Lachnospiraceae bacterium]MDO5127190.1 patatin-like phospholipase family protein [Eubacteriales bacterium]
MGELHNNQGTGLVLSGGGGKGAYQVGVLKALKENGKLNDVVAISGASIGSINAMLFAMDDMELMHNAWDEIDMSTVFDIDLEMLMDNRHYFSRDEMLEMISKYIDFNKVKNGKYEIYNAICKIVPGQTKLELEYRKLQDYDEATIKKILLASSALPIIYEAVEIDGAYYRDGGICDNEPVQPLYDAGIRQFIVIGLARGKNFDTSKWPDANFITIYPSHDIGSSILGTINFTDQAINFREKLGYKDGLRSIKTKFEKDDTYIQLEATLAENDYNEIMMQMRVDTTYERTKSRIDSNIEKFEALANLYKDY